MTLFSEFSQLFSGGRRTFSDDVGRSRWAAHVVVLLGLFRAPAERGERLWRQRAFAQVIWRCSNVAAVRGGGVQPRIASAGCLLVLTAASTVPGIFTACALCGCLLSNSGTEGIAAN